jgi:hypothetical protein
MSPERSAPTDAPFRSPHVNRAWVEEALPRFEREFVEARRRPPDETPGPPNAAAARLERLSFCADAVARFRYIAGAELESVRGALEESTRAYCEMSRREHDVQHWTRTNSKKSLQAMCAASAIGALDLLREIATLTWDPPHSDGFATAEHHLAYALKALVLGDRPAVAAELKLVRTSRLDLQLEWSMARAILRGAKPEFLADLTKLLAWNARFARLGPGKAPAELRATDFLLCTPGLGLAGLAVRAGMIEQSDLPATDPYFPRALLDASVSS